MTNVPNFLCEDGRLGNSCDALLMTKRTNIEDTHREKAPSNKNPALTKSTNMGAWAVGKLNQLFIRGSFTETKLSKKKTVTGKTPYPVIGPFCSYHSVCLNIGF